MRLLVTVFFVLFTSTTMAAEIKPVMLYDSEKILDDSWNELIHNGVKRFERKTNIPVKEEVFLNNEHFTSQIYSLAKQGFNPIMTNNLDEEMQQTVKKVMLDYPSHRFIIFNGAYNIPNAHYFVFSTQESSFLAGYLAVKKSKTKKIGFVGGMDIPVIRNFLCGYLKGAHYADPDARVVYNYIGDSFSAWSNPEKAFSIAQNLIADGADVIFTPAGGSGLGALKAAHENGVLGIGVDQNQNHEFPGSVLTSAVVHVDNAAYRALMASYRNVWRDQLKVMGLQEKGVSLAFDKYNAPLVSDALRAEIETLQAKIILNEIELPNYILTNTCNDKNGPLL